MAETKHTCHCCGADLLPYGIGKLKCKYCESIYEDDVINSEEGILLANAYKLLRAGETDEAYEDFIGIIQGSPKCYEAYMGAAMANHGIVYVEDTREGKTRKRVPTCYNTTLNPFKEDSYFQEALRLAPDDIAENYRHEAEIIDEIREKWLDIASKEKPYDVFISYKDSDDETKARTKDSVDAMELYDLLREKGYKVFYSKVTLRTHISEDYEPYVYNALHTAKVMIVYAESAAHFNARWVRNEWGRWWKLIESGKKHPQSLIVAYKDMNVYDIPKQLLRGMQAVDMAGMSSSISILDHIKKIKEALEAESGIVRVEVAGFNGKKATRIAGEKITKKQLGTGIKKVNNAAVAGAVTLRDVSAKTQTEISISGGEYLDKADKALERGRFKNALNFYQDAALNGAGAKAWLGILLSQVNVKTDEAFVKDSAKSDRWYAFDNIIQSCTKEELQRTANLFRDSEKECLKTNAISSAIKFFKKLTAYNIPQRQEALDILRNKISEEMKKKESASLERLCDAYCDAVIGDDPESYIEQVSSLIDEAMTNSHYDDIAKNLNNRLDKIEGAQGLFIYNDLRIQLKTDFQGDAALKLYDLEDFSVLDKLLSNVTQSAAETLNRTLVHAVFIGLNSVFEKKNKKIQERVVELFKILISYTYENYYLEDQVITEAQFKFAFFEQLTENNVKHPMFTDKETTELKEYILKTMDENAVDEYAAYEILLGVQKMRIGSVASAKACFTQALKLIPNDSNARILQMCCDYGITEKDVNAVMFPSNKKCNISAGNAVIYALLKKIGDDIATESFTSHIQEILKYCKKNEDWRKDAQSSFYVANVKNDIFYKYLATYQITEKAAVTFATISRQNLNYKYEPQTQYDFVIRIFTDEILSLMNDSNKKEVESFSNGYYKILQYIDADNRTFMCERLKFMGDYMLISRNFDQAVKFYSYAIQENQMDGELYWKRLHASLHAVDTIELILSNDKVDDAADFESVLKLVEQDQLDKYYNVPNKQEYLMRSKSDKALLRRKKDFIPEQDIDYLFECGEDDFANYLKELSEKVHKEQEQKKENRNKAFGKAMTKAGEYAKTSIVLLLSLIFVAVSAVAALKIDLIYGLFGITEGSTVSFANQVALVGTGALFTILQFYNFATLKKRKLWLTIVQQIFVMAMIAISEYVLRKKLPYFDDTIAWGFAVGTICVALAYCIWQFTAKTPNDSSNAIGKSISTIVMTFLFLILPNIFQKQLPTRTGFENAFVNTQTFLIAVMVLCMTWGVFSDLKHPGMSRSWKAIRTFIAVHIVIGIVIAIANAILGYVSFLVVSISTVILIGLILLIKKS